MGSSISDTHTASPPPSAIQLSAIDQSILAMEDSQFELHSWTYLKNKIAIFDHSPNTLFPATNNLQNLYRKPSDLRRYVAWCTVIKSRYGTIPTYIMEERLKWTPLPSSTPVSGPLFARVNSVDPFAEEADYRILPNDWPYGMEPGIRHLVVWLKGSLDVDQGRGDMTAAARRKVEGFVEKKFGERIDRLVREEGKDPEEGERWGGRLMWFRNWTALQSVPGLEHVHILLRDVPDEVVREWIGEEVAVQETR